MPLAHHLGTIIERIHNYDPNKDYINMIDRAVTIWDNLEALKLFYRDNKEDIIWMGKNNPRKFYDIFSFNLENIFSPIEFIAWRAIRYESIVLYPQYPALNYILDFANPYLKIALEMDGKEFHKDKEKDRIRDQKLYDKEGWKVFRITGAEVYSNLHKPILTYYSPCAAVYEYFHKSMEGVIEAINQVYFYSPDIIGDNEQCIYNTCVASLECHKYADFEI